jgi:arsenate reductase
MQKILFLCVANSARSQLAEAIARDLVTTRQWPVEVWSAGSNPGSVHPMTHRVLAEIGLDSSTLHSKSVSDLPDQNYDLIFTLCQDEVCPLPLSQNARHLHMPFPDPAAATEPNEQLDRFRTIRDQIRQRLSVELPKALG